ncbi:DUF6089 family protein [Thermophagus xiamenensis]|jgi:hypothetical protein|uniref:DUF6089 domain-containing protein n=1 Tax=Thermophagus xiamenensis TaxID=385682 RepID=A0A1I1XR15_9BACT|nr:DUF6089 family protein [Thermophagus xiamenensis]SFE09744.1 hypothetical protein SAMN05444380_106127 [Thermophagus xiamenensis]
MPNGYRICFVIAAAFILFFPGAKGQERIEAGFILGASYYQGDLNSGKLFYRAQPALGGLMRVVINHRLALKGALTMVNIQGDYPAAEIFYPSQVGYSSGQYHFERTMADISAQLEINFFEYDNPYRREETRFTPFISTGIASTLYRRYNSDGSDNSENPHFILSLPFGIGIKWKLYDWMHIGMEWNFRKTFVDDLDKTVSGAIDPSDPYGFDQYSLLHNNDWYSFAGIFVSIDLFHRSIPCNAGY